MTIKQLESIVGSLSKPSKMPCYGYSIPAKYCKIGQKLRNIKGTVCYICYALKGRYVFASVLAAMEKRYQSLNNPDWVKSMAELINRKEKSGFFRWHDSGDLQDAKHLAQICTVARFLPHVKFWLPTREYKIVNSWIASGQGIPDNLTIRFSALRVNGSVTKSQNPFDLPTSEASDKGFSCPSSLQGNKCGDCRACWDKNVKIITYKKH